MILRENFSKIFWPSPGLKQMGESRCLARRPEKNWWQAEKVWAAGRCVYIPRPDVETKYELLIPAVITFLFFQCLQEDFSPSPGAKSRKSVAGREIRGCGRCVYIQARRPDNLQTSSFQAFERVVTRTHLQGLGIQPVQPVLSEKRIN